MTDDWFDSLSEAAQLLITLGMVVGMFGAGCWLFFGVIKVVEDARGWPGRWPLIVTILVGMLAWLVLPLTLLHRGLGRLVQPTRDEVER